MFCRQTDIKHIMSDIVQSYGAMAPLGVAFYSTIARSVPPFVFLDPLRIRQILANGVTNALKYTSLGEVRVHVSTPGTNRAGNRRTLTCVFPRCSALLIDSVP